MATVDVVVVAAGADVSLCVAAPVTTFDSVCVVAGVCVVV